MKVRFLPYQPHCFAFGGFELQMLAAFDELKKIGADVEKLDVWDRDHEFDILHCWGLGLANYENIIWGKKANKKVVVTSLHGYFETNIEKIRFYVSSFIHKHKFNLEMISNIDKLIVMNEKQADVSVKYFKIPANKVEVIPNVINEKFFSYKATPSDVVKPPYILCVGNICQRKNQVNLAQSCLELDIPLILIGKKLLGEDEYAARLTSIINKSDKIEWIQGLPENSDILLKYFAGCTALALPSFAEQQPISLLEAATLRKPLIIADRDYARQKYYSNSKLVEPSSVSSIKAGLSAVMNSPANYYPDLEPLLDCKGINVAKAYLEVYSKLLS